MYCKLVEKLNIKNSSTCLQNLLFKGTCSKMYLKINKTSNSSRNGFAFHYILMQNHYEQWKSATCLSNLNAKWIGLWSIQKALITINISFWKVGKNVVNDKNGGL